MEKFTKVQNKKVEDVKEKTLYKNDSLSIEDIDGVNCIRQSDVIVCIPYFTQYNQILLKQESNSIFKEFKGQELNISPIIVDIVEGEDMKLTLMKGLESKIGLVLRDKFPIEFDSPLFETKNSNRKCYYTIIPLSESDYHEVLVRNDIKKDTSKNVRVDAKFINKLQSSDITTELMMIKLKKYLNIL